MFYKFNTGSNIASKAEAIQTGVKEYLAVNYIELIPVLIKALQEEDAKNKALEERIQKLEEYLKKNIQ